MNRIGILAIGIAAVLGTSFIITLHLLGMIQIENTLLALIFFGQLVVVGLQLLLFWLQLGIISAQSEPSLRPEFRREPAGFWLEIFNDSNNMARNVQFEQAWSVNHGMLSVGEELYKLGKGIKKDPPRAIAGGMYRSAVVCSIPGNLLRDRPAFEISYVNLSNKKQFIHFLLLGGDPSLGDQEYDIRRGRISVWTKLEMRGLVRTDSKPSQEVKPTPEASLEDQQPPAGGAAPQTTADQEEKQKNEASAKPEAETADKKRNTTAEVAGSKQSSASSEPERPLTDIEKSRRILDKIEELHKKKETENEEASKS